MAEKMGVGVNIRVKTKGAKEELKELGEETKKLKNNLKDFYSGLTTSVTSTIKAVKGFTNTIQSTINGMIKLASSQTAYIENLNLLDTAYGSTTNSGKELINTLSEVVGLDQSGLTKSLGTYRQMTSALGMAGDTANTLSENLLKMQLDMSSLYNLDFSRAGEILQTTLSGNTKSIRTLGGDVTEATLAQTALNLGIEKSVEDMTRAEKTMLIYLTLEDQMSNAQGDLAKTYNSVSNQTKVFTEQISTAGRQIGGVFIPILKSLLPYLNGILMAFNSIASSLLSFLGIDAETIADEFGIASSEVEDLDDYTSSVADNLGNASTSASELSKSLRSFDKLNVITTPTSTSSGGTTTTTSSGTGIDTSILEALSDYDLNLDNISSKASGIKDQILEWLGIFERLKEPLEDLGELTFDGLKYIWNEVLKPLGEWVAWEFMPSVLDLIGEALEFIYKTAKNLQPSAQFLFENIVKPIARVTGSTFLDIIKGIADVLDTINSNPILSKGTSIATGLLLVYEVGKKLYTIFNVSKLAGTVSNFASTLLDVWKISDYKLVPTLSNLHTILKKQNSIYSKCKTGLDKFKTGLSQMGKVLAGATGVIASTTLFSEGLQDIKENGPTIGGIISTLAGALGIIATAYYTATAAADLFNISTGNFVGIATTIMTVIGLVVGVFTSAADDVEASAEDAEGNVDDLTQSINDQRDALKDLQDQAKDTAEETKYLTDRQSDYVDELSNYIDANGKVKKSDEDRVEYILKNLSDALGEEYELIDGVVYINGKKADSYDDVKNSITKVITEKKKEAYLDAYQDVYIEAIKQKTKAYEDLYEAYKTGNEDAVEAAEKSYKEAENTIKAYEDLVASNDDTMEECVGNFEKAVDLSSDITTDAFKKAKDEYETAQRYYASNPVKIKTEVEEKNLSKGIETMLANKTFQAKIKANVQLKIKASITEDTEKQASRIIISSANAQGGFPKTGDLFLANENEPEYVGKLGNKTTVANQTQITDGIRNATKQGFMDAITMAKAINGGSSKVEIVAEGDTSGLLNFIKFKQKEKNRQFGM